MWAYFGSKFYQSPWIETFIPTDIEAYVEPFGGAFWVYLKSQLGTNVMAYPNLRTIVYNDLNKNNVNAWRAISQFPNEMLKICQDMYLDAWDHEVYKQFMIDLNVPVNDGVENRMDEFELLKIPDCQRAMKYMYALSVTFAGASMTRTRTVVPRGREKQFHSIINRLKDNPTRLKLKAITHVDCKDFRDCIVRYDRPGTFFYCDPPYFGGVAQYNSDTFGKRGHTNVREHEYLSYVLKGMKGRWALSYYEFPQLSEWFPKDKYRWAMREFNHGGQGRELEQPKDKAKEILIMNY